MTKKGPEFYDDDQVFSVYREHRTRSEVPNDSMEQPALWDLIGNVRGLSVLDLGCGDARVAKIFEEKGASRYVGIEGSQRMAEAARANLTPGFSEVRQLWLEDFVPEKGAYDLVVSSLALHYLEDLGSMLSKACESLRAGGRMVFSVEHPVITSCNRSLANTTIRESWIIDDYFTRGPREVKWLGNSVVKVHRTVEDYLQLLREAGFAFEQLSEAEPRRELFSDAGHFARRSRIPLFLVVAAVKR